MKRTLAFVLSLLFIMSVFVIGVSASDNGPKVDGVISRGEYDGGVTVDVKPSRQTYYVYNAAVTQCLAFDQSMVEARGSKMIASSKIYAYVADDGIYFAYDIADTTYGSNVVRDYKIRGGCFWGDAVHVILKQDNKSCSANKLVSGEAIRISVAPFKADFNAINTSKRKVDFACGATLDIRGENPNCIDLEGLISRACKADESGYVVEFFVPWSTLEMAGFKGPLKYDENKLLYANFIITDAMGRKSDGLVDWAIFQCPVNSSFIVSEENVTLPNSDTVGFKIYDDDNWSSVSANTGVKLVRREVIPTPDTDDSISFAYTKYSELGGEQKINTKSGATFKSLTIDGKDVDEKWISSVKNGQYIKVKNEFFDSINQGVHNAKINYTDGSFDEIKFSVIDVDINAQTSDGSAIALAIVVLALSAGALIAVFKKKELNPTI